MRVRVWVRDLLAATWTVVVGIVSAGFTVAAAVAAVSGLQVATPWLVVGALASLLLIVFTAYVRAARARDDLGAGNAAALRDRVRQLERNSVQFVESDETSLTLRVNDEGGDQS